MPMTDDSMNDDDFDAAFGDDNGPPIVLPPMQPSPQQAAPRPQAPGAQQRPMPPPLMPQQMRQPPPGPQQRPTPQPPQQRPLRTLAMPPQRPMPQPPRQQMSQQRQQTQMSPFQPPFALPLPPGLGAPVPEENFFQKKVGGLPVWAWGLLAAGGGTVAYFVMKDDKKDKKDKKVKKNFGSSEASPKRFGKSSSEGWSPSRGTFCDALETKFSGKFEKVYNDADDAKGTFKTVSPLINVKAKPGYKIDKAFEAFCKADGLHPVMHDDNEIGIYPADGTARGREWENYVDLLRDDGQTV